MKALVTCLCLCLCAVAVKGMPSEEQFSVCLRKIKMAFNLLVRFHFI